MPDNLLTVKEAAEKLSVSPRTIQRYCRQGKLKHKWVQGVRHRELRIFPPLYRRGIGGVVASIDTVSRDDYEVMISRLERELEAKDQKLERLSMELGRNQELVALIVDYKARIQELKEEIMRLQETVDRLSRETRLGEIEKKLFLSIAKDLSALKKSMSPGE